MTKRRGRSYPPGMRSLLEKAVKNGEGSSVPRKHHVIPASYLKNWAVKDRITVTDVNAGTTYPARPTTAARITDFYRIESKDVPEGEVPPLLAETLLSVVEGWGAEAVRQLRRRPDEIDPVLATQCSAFLAFQITRGLHFRRTQSEMANKYFKLRFGRMTDEGIRETLRSAGHEPTDEAVADARRFIGGLKDGTMRVQPQQAQLVMEGLRHAEELAPRLLGRAWVIYKTPRMMITCDEPVVPIEGPGGTRGQVGGIGTAGVIVFPLSPTETLAMVHEGLAPRLGINRPAVERLWRDELDEVDTAQLVKELVAHTHRWTFEVPDRKRVSKLKVPAAPEPFSMDDPIKIGDDDGATHRELVRFFNANRWSNDPHPPEWPVERWWY